MKIQFAKCSIAGRRDYNQDYVLAEKLGPESWLFIVADGMGGTKGGEVASALAAETLYNNINQIEALQPEKVKDQMEEIFREIQICIGQESSSNEELADMGTTIVCLLIVKNTYVWASLGDSRLYKINEAGIEQLTEDHTFVQDYINKNGSALPDAISSQYEHMLTKSLDGNIDSPDIFPLNTKYSKLQDGDSFMLCSDGLILDKINTNAQLFKNYVLGSGGPVEAVNNLVGYAFEAGSKDNISAIVIKAGEKEYEQLKLKSYALPEKTLELKKSLIDRFRSEKEQNDEGN